MSVYLIINRRKQNSFNVVINSFTVIFILLHLIIFAQNIFMDKLKQRWGIESNFQIAIIILVFAINGSLAVFLTNPITNILGIHKETTVPLLYWPVRILAIFIIYQITLVIVGALFGQKRFFWNMEKKMLQRLGLGKVINLGK